MRRKILPHAFLSLGVLLSACEQKFPLGPLLSDPITVEIIPKATTELGKGQTLALNAIVRGASNPLVTWQSSAQNVVSVSAIGLVTAVDTGSAWVRAFSQADVSARDSIRLHVGPGASPLVPQPGVWFDQITPYGTTTPLDYDRVTGEINITVHYDVSKLTPGRLEIFLNTTRACDMGIITGNASASCVVNTAQLIGAVPRFPNGTYTPKVTLSTTTTVIALATFRPITITN